MVGAAVTAYVAAQRPSLEVLAVKLLNVAPGVRDDLVRQLEEAQPQED
jgi:hypothetical protein